MEEGSKMWILIHTLIHTGGSSDSNALTTPTTLEECQGYLLRYSVDLIKNAEYISSEVIQGTFPGGIIVNACVPML